MTYMFPGMVALAVLLLTGVMTMANNCTTKCRLVEHFTKDSHGTGEEAATIYSMFSENNGNQLDDCRRIWRTDDPADDIPSGFKIEKTYRRLLREDSNCNVACWELSGVFGRATCEVFVFDEMHEPQDIDCWSHCIEDTGT